MKSSLNNKFALAFLLFAAVPFTGCMQSVIENATESEIEKSVGGDVDLDLDNGSMNIKKDGETYQAGDYASWPSNMPSDVYQIDGTVISSMSNLEENSYWVMVQPDASADEATSIYESQLAEEGWTITATANYAGTNTLTAEKDNRQLAIMVTSADGQTSVTISESQQ